MCGIFVYISKTEIKSHILSDCKKVCDDFIVNRGPDKTLSYVGSNFFLQQSILSISSPYEKTTMSRELDRPPFLFVGEIYDFQPDKEISELAEHTPSSFFEADPDGMYALVWLGYDQRGNISEVNVRTDPQGEKRLFFFEDANRLIISSVAGAITKFIPNPKLNRASLYRYLASRHFLGLGETFFKDLNEFGGGHLYRYIVSDNKGIQKVSEYNFSSWFNLCSTTGNKSLRQKLDAQCSMFLKHNNKSKSTFIFSGGVDSSISAALLSSRSPEQHELLCLSFKDKNCSSHEAKVLAEKIGLERHLSTITVQKEDYLETAIRCVELCAGVIPTHSMPSTMLLGKYAKTQGTRILYGGEGADEAFLGYSCYLELLNGTKQQSDYTGIEKNLEEFAGASKTFSDMVTHIENSGALDGLRPLERRTKIFSILDFFFQCRSVGFYSSDIGLSDFGIEGRSLFARRSIASYGFASNPSRLASKRKLKAPLHSEYQALFGKAPIPKVGFAGYPNEISLMLLLPELNGGEKALFQLAAPSLSQRDLDWKRVNYTLFKRTYGIELD